MGDWEWRGRPFGFGVCGGAGGDRLMLRCLRHETPVGDVDFVVDVEESVFRVLFAGEIMDVPLNGTGLRLLAGLLNDAAADLDARGR